MEEANRPFGVMPPIVRDEDVDENGVLLEYENDLLKDRDLLDYVEKFIASKEGYPEYYRAVLQDIFSNPSLVTSTIWVEDPVTGTFAPQTTGVGLNAAHHQTDNPDRMHITDDNNSLEKLPATNLASLDKEYPEIGPKAILIPPTPLKVTTDEEADQNSHEWTLVTMDYRNFAFIRRLGFLFFQGLLAGFAVITTYVHSTSNEEDSNFLSTYQPVANEIRRYFYLLTVLSLVGSADYLLTLFSANQTRYSLIEYLSANIAAKYVDFHKITLTTCMAIVICYIIAFIITLIMSRFDVDVYMKYNLSSIATESWMDQALADSTFTERLNQWEALDRIRLVVVLLAWLAGCALLWMDISRYSKLWLNLKMMRTTALAWMRRTKALEGGKELDGYTAVELKEVVSALEIGLHRAKGILALKEDSMQA